ncbi:hypothetical protein Misp01_75410 [Microtetraspora sp. NBRC 13810]|uniref:hypothetical protein n=1 Tax=Microtetraspora sp. NBRC 13810 TaxID=3030990 RepID=UPI0024A57593|nr:hypothetical protein [Microtetraspora sp. NBRC 13810]GLW12413.1 hypothetical protein Misp01_75410 [Microtetraspora sp. NBRC 13810]
MTLSGIPRTTEPATRPPEVATAREDLITVLCSAVMISGLAVDGWAHKNVITTLEGFFTPYHALMYAGYALTAAWSFRMAYQRRHRVELWWRDGWPRGYRLGALGALIFGVGGFGDMIWHQAIGIEIGLLPSFSPTHILASVGGIILGTSPLRSWWASGEGGLRSFTGVVAMTYAAMGALVMLNYGASMMTLAPTQPYEPVLGVDYGGIIDTAEEFLAVQGVSSYVITTLLLTVPLLLMHRRRATFGAGTALVAGVSLRLMVINEFPDPYLTVCVAAVCAGLLADLALVRLDAVRGPDAPLRLPAAGALYAALVCAGQLLGLQIAVGLRWPPEMWTGTVVLVAGLGALLGGLAARPAPADTRI